MAHTFGRAVGFDIYKFVEDQQADAYGFMNWEWVQDTGQDAHEVLAEWEAAQEASDAPPAVP
ncbi:MAG: hypothetical protein KDE45_19140 [Caldilineaceae bacterium]|nr:hypothetical protein [Caldilineaceae bacterium]